MENQNRHTARVAAALSFIPAYGYVRYIFFREFWQGTAWYMTALTAVSLFLFEWTIRQEEKSGTLPHRITKEAVLSEVCALLLGLSFGLQGIHEDLLGLMQVLMWHFAVIYAVLARTGCLLGGRTSVLFPFDAVNGALVLPLTHFFLRAKMLYGRREKREEKKRKLPAVRTVAVAAVSILAAVLVSAIAVTELSAVSDSFASLGEAIREAFSCLDGEWARTTITAFVLSIPVGCYLFGLAGSCVQRMQKNFAMDPAERGGEENSRFSRLHAFPAWSLYLVVCPLLVIYALFFLLAGGWDGIFDLESITAYNACESAVSGFWQLVRVMILNFSVLYLAFLLGEKPFWKRKGTRAAASLLLVFGLGFAFLAFWKLFVLYIGLYGPTPRRIFAGWVLMILVLWDVLALIRLHREIPAARTGILAALVSFVILVLLPIGAWC